MTRTILVGDIHGCYAELLDLLDAVGINDDDHLISLGDLVDRGPDPGPVVDRLRQRPRTTVLCGNHERKHVRGLRSASQEIARLQMGAGYEAAVAWMGTLPYHYEDPSVRAVHFGHFPGTPLDAVPEDVRAGTTSGEARLRERYGGTPWWEHYADEVPIAFGHHVVGSAPLIHRDRVYGLDTGACFGGRLTALILPSRQIVSVPARADHWRAVRKDWEAPLLRTQDWSAMTWEQLDRRLAKVRDPALTNGHVDAIAAWAAGLRGQIPALAAALQSTLDAMRAEVGAEGLGRAAAAHPAGGVLVRLAAGKLSPSHLGCAGPADVIRLAAQLGIPTAPAP